MKNTLLLSKFKKQLMKCGKLYIATKLLHDVFLEISMKGYIPKKVLVGAINNTKPLISIRQVRVGGNLFAVPFPKTLSQQFTSSINLLIRSAKAQRLPLKRALANELILSYQGKSSSVKEIEKLHESAIKNKVFSTYRWF